MRSLLLIWLFSFLFIPSKEQEGVEQYKIRGFTQGTSYQITYYAKEKAVTKHQIEQVLSSIDSSLSIYKPYSLISRFNRSETGLQADEHLKSVVKKSFEVSEKTEGAFDITIQPLVQAWGFGTSVITALPDSSTIDSLLECTGFKRINFQKNFLRKEESCIRIDVNGIAQGYTVDVLAALLENAGIENYLVEVGGEIKVKGRKPNGKLMAIGIEGPGEEESSFLPVQVIIWLPDGAVTTSGNYRKYLLTSTQKLSHLIDPDTGYPFQNEMISVTVWAKDAITADGYDNALMGVGLKNAIEIVERQKNLEAYFIYRLENGAVADTASSGFYQLMEE